MVKLFCFLVSTLSHLDSFLFPAKQDYINLCKPFQHTRNWFGLDCSQQPWLLINFLMTTDQKYTVVRVSCKLKIFLCIVILDIYKCFRKDRVYFAIVANGS